MRRLLFAALAIPLILPSQAMTQYEKEITCPYDGTRFTAKLLGSGSVMDYGLDEKYEGSIESPIPFAVCPTNGFVFYKEFTAKEIKALRPLVLSDEYQRLKGETSYYKVAWILKRTNAPAEAITKKLLQATWQAKDDPVRYKRYAEELLERLQKAEAEREDKDEPTTYTLLIGELLRRLGRFDEADAQFASIKGIDPESDYGKIIAFQRRLIAARDNSYHLRSEAVPDE